MVYPIIAYGHPKLRQKCNEIQRGDAQLRMLLENMWNTLYAANGAGLAAPQIGRSLRLFVVDTVQMYENSSYKERKLFITDKGIKEAFINPVIIEKAGEEWTEQEGCLSIPAVQLDIKRKMTVVIKYLNSDFVEQEKIFSGVTARTILHEYDHIEGILFTDYVDKESIREELDKITRGEARVNYKMTFNKIKKIRKNH